MECGFMQLPENVRRGGEKMPIYSRKIHIFLIKLLQEVR